nr:uncharacterized protein LOC109771090 [Aegilops tauschii subsp. strangulata]
MDISNDHDYLHLLPEDEGGGRVGGGGGGGGEEVFGVGLLRQVLRCSFEGIQQLGAAMADIVPSTTGTDAPDELEFAGGGDDPEFVALGTAIVANTADIILRMAGGDEKEEDEEVEEEEDSEDYDAEEEEETLETVEAPSDGSDCRSVWTMTR